MVSPFSEDKYKKGVATLKNNKVAGRDDVLGEQLKNLGPKASQMAARNVKQLLHRQQDPNNMEIIQDYRHTETRE